MDKKKTKKAAGPPRAKRAARKAARPPVYFLSLTVENVRCFGGEKQTLDLSDGHGRPAHWTVLLGDNGTGKTTLLECLVAFHADKSIRERVVLGSLLGEDKYRRRASDTPEFEVSAVAAYGATLHSLSTTFGEARFRMQVGESWASWAPQTAVADSALPSSYAYGTSRRMGSTSLSDRASDDPTGSLFDDTISLRNAEEWLLRLDYAATKESKVQQQQRARFELVRDLLVHILPDVTDLRISNPTKARPQPAVEFKTPDGWLPLRWIGYGYRTLLAWMVDLASRMVERYPDGKDPLAEPAVVLVDEIDLHLHPRWQRTLMSYLSERFPNTQFIVTAHSPLFVQAAADANIVLLRRDEKKKHVVIENKVEVIKGWRVDQVLTSDLFGLESARPPDLEKLLQQRKKLLTKPKLTKADRKKLAELEERIGPLPGGETAQDAKTMALLEGTLQLLQKKRGGKS